MADHNTAMTRILHRSGKSCDITRSYFARQVNTIIRPPFHACEVGVYYPEVSQIRHWIGIEGVRCTLIEPLPDAAASLRANFGLNVHVIEAAIMPATGVVTMVHLDGRECTGGWPGGSSYVIGIDAPATALPTRRGLWEKAEEIEVQGIPFSHVDSGDIDILAVDAEGCEWNVISNMISRPLILSLEMTGPAYKNPHADDLHLWLHRNGYRLWYIAGTDEVYRR